MAFLPYLMRGWESPLQKHCSSPRSSIIAICMSNIQTVSVLLLPILISHHYIVLIKIAEFLTPNTNNEGKKRGKK